MSGRKTFTAGEVLQAADVNDFLMDQSVMVFAGTAARSSAIPSPTEGMVTYRSDDDVVEVYDGSSFVPVGPGQILQVVHASTSTETTIATTTYTDTTLEATITPSSTSSKVLISCAFHAATSRSSNNLSGRVRILRSATEIYKNTEALSNAMGGLSTTNLRVLIALQYLDSPSTTSATTYKVQASPATTNDSAQFIAQFDNQPSTITLMEVAG